MRISPAFCCGTWVYGVEYIRYTLRERAAKRSAALVISCDPGKRPDGGRVVNVLKSDSQLKNELSVVE